MNIEGDRIMIMQASKSYHYLAMKIIIIVTPIVRVIGVTDANIFKNSWILEHHLNSMASKLY